MSNLRQVLNSLPYYFLEDLLQELLGKISVSNRSTQIKVLAEALERRETLRSLWERLRPEEQEAVRLALYNDGRLDLAVYEALFGELPEKSFSGLQGYRRKPRYLKLFFLTGWDLPEEYHATLKEWVRPPVAHVPTPLAELPQSVQGEAGPAPLHVVETEQAAWHDLAAVLRLAAAGRLRVSETSRLPNAAAVRTLQRELILLDYYTVANLTRAADTIRPVGLVLGLQAAGWLRAEGDLVSPTPAGLAWLENHTPEGLREAFQTWLNAENLDELHRLSLLRGLNSSHVELSPPPGRREAILAALGEYPVGEWIAIEEFFKTLKLRGHAFPVETDESTSLQIQGYGLLDNASLHTYWRAVTGPYILAVLMEYLATFGALDFACVEASASPYALAGLKGYVKRPLSRYDGLLALRLTPLGAWLMGQSATYNPAGRGPEQPLLAWEAPSILALRGVQALNPNDRAMLESIAHPTPAGTYRLDAGRTVAALEAGLQVEEALAFLRLRTGEETDPSLRDFFTTMRRHSQVLIRKHDAFVYQVKDIALMKTLLQDEKLASYCTLAEDHQIVVDKRHEAAFRKRLRELEAGIKD